MKRHTHRTILAVSLGESEEHELTAKVFYTAYPGAPATREEPGHGADVELTSIHIEVATNEWVEAPEWLFGLFFSDKSLLDELVAEAVGAEEYARDQAADARREEMMLERGQ